MSEGSIGSAILRQSLRRLVLPIQVKKEDEALCALVEAGKRAGIEVCDLEVFLRMNITAWEQSGSLGGHFKFVVGEVLRAVGEGAEVKIAAAYFDLYDIAQRDPFRLTPREARFFLAQVPLMISLCQNERMSAAQIVRLLHARDCRVVVSWMTVRKVLERLGVYQGLVLEEFVRVFEGDRDAEEGYFADASIREGLGGVVRLGEELGMGEELSECLEVLLRPEGLPLYSTLEILHYQLMIAEFFDHDVTVAYEHSPRGECMNWLHGQYPACLIEGKQPFLNIAKSVYRLTEEWALPKDESQNSLALARLLGRLGQLGFAARREFGEKLRWLIHRVLKVHEGGEVWVQSLDDVRSRRAMQGIAVTESVTQGILEQRLTDVVGSVLRPTVEGWRASAIGDSVFATNRSGLKFGDCEFVHHGRGRIVAYESRAGTLSEIYVEDHLASLVDTMVRRKALLEQEFDLDNLRCEVIFVAHNVGRVGDVVLQDREIEGVSFEFQTTTFLSLIDDGMNRNGLVESVERNLVVPLNNGGKTLTPQGVRNRFLEIAGDDVPDEIDGGE